jgi:hypothetical protein
MPCKGAAKLIKNRAEITIYAPMIYTAPFIMFWMPLPNPLPLALVMDMHASKTLCTGLYAQEFKREVSGPILRGWRNRCIKELVRPA